MNAARYRMSLISTGSISLDSTFKALVVTTKLCLERVVGIVDFGLKGAWISTLQG
jgi:hypothetical protein